MARKEFPNDVVERAWKRANGRCQCTRTSHTNHKGKHCDKQLSKENRGRENGWGAWEAHHKNGDESDNSYENCEILCWECHKQTF